MNNDIDFLKEVLSIPTKTYEEDLMIDFLVDWMKQNRIPFSVDEYGNVYATKQTGDVDEHFIFPCVVAHTDTVHNIDTINIREEVLLNEQNELKPSLKAYNDNGNPTGIGGDNKCGVFACLQLLKELPFLKAAFFVSEETGCHGSKNADRNFFSNVYKQLLGSLRRLSYLSLNSFSGCKTWKFFCRDLKSFISLRISPSSGSSLSY